MQELVAMMLLRIFPIEDPGNRMDFDKFDKRLLELIKEFRVIPFYSLKIKVLYFKAIFKLI